MSIPLASYPQAKYVSNIIFSLTGIFVPAVQRNKCFTSNEKHYLTDIKTVTQGVYRMFDIIKTHMSTRCQFQEVFHTIPKKKEKRTKNMTVRKVQEIVPWNMISCPDCRQEQDENQWSRINKMNLSGMKEHLRSRWLKNYHANKYIEGLILVLSPVGNLNCQS